MIGGGGIVCFSKVSIEDPVDIRSEESLQDRVESSLSMKVVEGR